MSFKPKFIRGHNNYDTKQASDAASPSLENPDYWGPSLTVQSQADDADINIMMARFGVTGKMPENVNLPQYGHFDQILDYRSALDAVRNAQENFMQIPAQVRARFNNDPQTFMEFVHDPKNLPEMRQMGLAKPAIPEVPSPPVPPPVAPPQGTNPGEGTGAKT